MFNVLKLLIIFLICAAFSPAHADNESVVRVMIDLDKTVISYNENRKEFFSSKKKYREILERHIEKDIKVGNFYEFKYSFSLSKNEFEKYEKDPRINKILSTQFVLKRRGDSYVFSGRFVLNPIFYHLINRLKDIAKLNNKIKLYFTSLFGVYNRSLEICRILNEFYQLGNTVTCVSPEKFRVFVDGEVKKSTRLFLVNNQFDLNDKVIVVDDKDYRNILIRDGQDKILTVPPFELGFSKDSIDIFTRRSYEVYRQIVEVLQL